MLLKWPRVTNDKISYRENIEKYHRLQIVDVINVPDFLKLFLKNYTYNKQRININILGIHKPSCCPDFAKTP